MEAGTATARLNFTCRNIFPHAALSAFISFLYAVAEIHNFHYTFHKKYFVFVFAQDEGEYNMQSLKKKLLSGFAAFLVGLALTGGTALAHTMPFSETTLILEKGHGLHAEIRPGDPLSKVRDILGDVYQENVKDFGPFRRVIWNYYGSEFSAVTLTSNTSPSEKLPLHGYTLRGVSFHTPSGFSISTNYDKIKDKYGEATSQMITEDGLTSYIYSFSDRPAALVFEVDQENRVRKIHCRQEV